MKIERIELENFRNQESLDLEFTEDRMLMLGRNGVGKSSVIDAISWVLTGRCRGVNAKGEGQRDLIRHGAERMAVTIHIDGMPPVRRMLAVTGSPSVSMKTEQILGQLKTTDGMLQAVLYGQTFFDLHHADAKALLMQALNVQIKRDDLPGQDIPKSMKTVDLDYLDTLYKTAFERRAVAKRERDNHHVPDKPKVVQIKTAGKSLKELQDMLADGQDALQALVKEQVPADAAVRAAERAIDEQAALDKSVTQLLAKKEAHEGMLAERRRHLAEAQVAAGAAKARTAEPVDSLTVQLREAEVLIEKLARHDPERGCVLSATIPCLTKGAEFVGQVDGLRRAVIVLGERIQAGTDRAAAIAAAEQSIRDEDRNVKYSEAQISEADTKLADANAAGDRLKELKAQLPDLREKAQVAGKAVADQRKVVDDLVTTVTQLTTQQAALAAYQAALERQNDLDTQVLDAEAAVKLLGPTGVRVAALGKALGQFEQSINQALAPFQFTLTITPEPWEVFVTKRGGKPIRFDMLSKGQRLWTGLAFQLALAQVSGLNLCVIDDAEAVVGQDRKLMTRAVMLAQAGQVIVSMAKADDEPAPTLDGLQVVRIEDPATVAA